MALADKEFDVDIIINRANVALARSQRALASLLPSKTEETTTHNQEEDDDWGGEAELAGAGSKRKADDDGLPDGAFKRRSLASNDKLLEQLMGKKALQARKKQDARKVPSHTAPQPLIHQSKPQRSARDESESEEEGRAAAFKSKKKQKKPVPPPQQQQDESVAGQDKKDEQADYVALEPAQPTTTDSESEQRPQKKVKGSYLDEILGKKAKKSKKKKGKPSAAEV